MLIDKNRSDPLSAMLLRDITAGELAMDSPGGYSADHIIGRAGSTVTLIADADADSVEVTGFDGDPYAAGFVPRSALRIADGGDAG